MNYLQPTVCKTMVQVYLLYDLDLCPGKLCSHLVPMDAHVVVYDAKCLNKW